MVIIGYDLHTGHQQITPLNTATGEIEARRCARILSCWAQRSIPAVSQPYEELCAESARASLPPALLNHGRRS